MHLVAALDLLSTFVFALVGARVAADRRINPWRIKVCGGDLRNDYCCYWRTLARYPLPG